MAISGTVPDGERVAASLPLQSGTHSPWVHTVDAEVIHHLLRQHLRAPPFRPWII